MARFPSLVATINGARDASYTQLMSNYGEGGFHADDHQDQNSLQRVFRENCLKPVTIKQINDSVLANNDNEFSINGVDIAQVEFVGVIRRVDGERESSIDLTIEDGTGLLVFKKWTDLAQPHQEVVEHYSAMAEKWVRVCGSIKMFQDRKTITNPRIKLVANYNQVTNHFLRAIAVYADAQGLTANGGSGGQKLLFVSENDDLAGPGSGQFRNRLLDFLRANAPLMAEGVPTRYIAELMGVAFDVVEAEAELLRDDGILYNGTDDNTWMLVEQY